MRATCWIVKLDGEEIMVRATTEASALHKAACDRMKAGPELRLGQGWNKYEICRSHMMELKKWLKEKKKVLM